MFRIPKTNDFESAMKTGYMYCMFHFTDVPRVVLMNKVDRLRASLADDVSNLFRRVEVKKKLNAVANFMNLLEMDVLPMSNYHNEPVPNTKKNVLALTNLKSIMDFANDFVQKESDKKKLSDFFK